ncbi:sigma factor-like helix-turn-helix DNA-binding protein [Streptomyces sp. NPDC051636]|uniref:sigma factor-like helix-turn-helix DNA-binding protein n=1 Tax=Streptomyces sp. NPDC051636 TaxID=3365663 RepID=UPI0037B7BE3B
MTPRTPSPREDFAAYAAHAWPRLFGTAHLLTGDPHAAQELARATLADTYARRRRTPRDDADFYVRRTLVRRYLRRARRLARGDGERAPLFQALGRLGPRQRVVLVLRHGEHLAEAEIAELLGCSAGAVRSYARRGLSALGALPVPGVRR